VADAPYRVLVTGSREFTDYATVCAELGGVLRHLIATARPVPKIVVVHGAARGADELAADWTAFGKSAGYRRNAEMVKLGADVCLAFFQQGAGNRGTSHCVRLAEAAGIRTRRVTNNG
jgi:hypothetical protein